MASWQNDFEKHQAHSSFTYVESEMQKGEAT
jgi:hypothetical protein